MKKIISTMLAIPLAMGLISPVQGQDGLAETLEALVKQNAKGYLSPLVTAFGTGANSGTFQRAKPHKILGFDVTLNAALVSVPEAAQEFEFLIPDNNISTPIAIPGYGTHSVDLPFNVLYSTGVMVPTFFGETDGVNVPVNNTAARTAIINGLVTSTSLDASTIETLAGSEIDNAIDGIPPLGGEEGISGIGVPLWPSIMPQFSVGLPMNVELTFRGFTLDIPESDDQIKLGGFGAKIGFSEFIPLFPVDLAAGYYATNLDLAGVVTGANTIMTLQASKSIPLITIYGGFGLESSQLSIKYDYTNPADQSIDTIKFDMEGDNKTRVIAGLRLKLALLTINADVNTGEYTAYNLGVGLTLR
ncbi:MAG: hypothetical protein JSW54_04730 [Fidelibacterota bacterium]|nr:MAG: hypothetical protein JSW54_04730 [Candidatus Neomarinimicrobiota bacterium]